MPSDALREEFLVWCERQGIRRPTWWAWRAWAAAHALGRRVGLEEAAAKAEQHDGRLIAHEIRALKDTEKATRKKYAEDKDFS